MSGRIAMGVLCVAVLGVPIAARLALASTERIDRDTHVSMTLRQLTSLQHQLAEHVLAVREGSQRHYDGLVEIEQEKRRFEQEIAVRLESEGAPGELVEAFRAYRALSDAQSLDLESFKGVHSLQRNSERYLATLAPEAVAEASAELDMAEMVLPALTALLDRTPNPALVERLRRLPERLSDAGHPRTTAFARHAHLALDYAARADGLAEAIGRAGIREALQRIVASHDAIRTERERRQVRDRTLYGALSLALALFLGGAFLRLRRSAAELETLNEGLEQEVKRRSAQIAQSQKLESIGQLAAGIAHEINTPAQYVSDNLEFLEQGFAELQGLLKSHEALAGEAQAEGFAPHRLSELEQARSAADAEFLAEEIPSALAQSRDGIGRVAKIVRAMKEFSHPGSEEPTPIDLNRAIDSTLTVARNEWKYVAELERSFGDLPPVPCLAGEFNQVVLNIVVNAAQAIGESRDGGEGGKGLIVVRTEREGEGWVRLEISDDGPGIPEAIRSRVFDPFFTTKDVGKGTGQGLAIARSVVVDKHGGTLEVESQDGEGTTFRIRLPLASAGRDVAA